MCKKPENISTGTVYGLFNDSFPPVLDGVTVAVDNYCRWLANSGRKVCVVTPSTPGTPPEGDYDIYRYFSLPIYNRHPYRYGVPALDPFIWRKVRSTPFRIVHSHSPFSSGRLAAYASRKRGVPLVATFHSKYRTDLERSLPRVMVEYQMRKMLRFYHSASEVWIPQASVEETIREYGYRGKLRVVENGNDFAEGIDDISVFVESSRKALGYPDGQIALLFVGQHILEKGVDIIIRTLPLLDGVDWRMDFVGEGYAKADMEALVRELGLDSKVTFHGLINDRDELRRIYAAADLFLFPSFYDNAPLVVREAAAMHTPAILLEGSTASELVNDGENGFLTGHTPQDYARVIRHLAVNRALIRQAGHGARNTLCRPWRDVVDEVIAIYDEIIQRHEKRQYT